METVFRPPPPMNFEGNVNEEWSRFKTLFNNFLKASKKDKEAEDVKVAMLLNLMGEKAMEIFSTLKLEEADRTKFDKVRKAFDDYCNPKDYITYERFKFYTRDQQPGESFDHFVTELTKQCKKCNFDDTSESIADQMVRDRIVLGTRSTDVQEKLLRMEKLTLAKAIELGRISEVTQQQAKEVQYAHPVNLVKKVNNSSNSKSQSSGSNSSSYKTQAHGGYDASTSKVKSRDHSSKIIVNCKNCSFSHKINKCPAYGKLCYRCNQKNHFSKLCRQKRIHQINNTEYISDDALESLVIDSMTIANIQGQNSDFWFIELLVHGKAIKFKIDSGSEVNIIPLKVFNQLFKSENIQTTKLNLEAYGGFMLRSIGTVNFEVNHLAHKCREQFVIADVQSSPILGLKTSLKLGLIKRIHGTNFVKATKEDIISKNKDLFNGLGCFPGKCKIKVRSDANPIVKPSRRIPLILKEKVLAKLNQMEKAQIINKVENPTGWVNNLVITEKPDKSIRLCLDPRELNVHIVKDSFEIPTLEDLVSKLEGMEYYTVLDLKDGFWQVELDEESKDLCTFVTPFGCYRFNRLPFGLNCAPEKFQKLNSKYFGNLKGTFVYIDDILVCGKTKPEHDENLNKVLDTARRNNIKFNPKKMQYCVKKVRYLGHIFSKDGIEIDPERCKAIHSMPEPKDKKDLQRFLGMVNYVRNFLPNLSESTAPLRELLRKNVQFSWLQIHSKIVEKLKNDISHAPILQNFRENVPATIQTDASKDGLGSCLLQNGKPISYASKSMSDTEKAYAQIEKELLAIVFACKRFHQYIYGRKITVQTDHKPLVSIFRKDISRINSSRIQRMRLKLLPYDLNVIYTPGKYMLVADTLSRACDNTDNNDVDSSLNEIVHSVNFSDNRIEKIRKEMHNDEEMLLLIKYCLNGWPEHRAKIPDLIKIYWPIRNEIYVERDLLFFQERLIIPKSMRPEILGILHESHMGTSKTKYLAKTTLYWPRIYKDIEETISNCRICEKYRSSNSKRELIHHDIPEIPFNKVACDLFQYKAKSYLVLVDYLSKWLEVCELQDKTSNEIKKHLKKIFCTHGIPETLIADNMPFNSFELRQFGKEWNFKIITSSPEYPRSNGLAEKGVHIAKSLLRKCEETNKDLESALLAYRNAPITGIKFSPSQILMSRLLRSKIPASNKTLKPKLCLNIITKIKSKQKVTKSYHDNHIRKEKEQVFSKGDNVVVQKGKIWEPAKVVGSYHTPRSYIVRTENNREIRRNSLHLRPSPHEPKFRVENDENEHSNTTTEPATNSDTQSACPGITSSTPFYVNRYGRIIKPPERYQASS